MSTDINRQLYIAFTDHAYYDGRVMLPWAEQLLGKYKDLATHSNSVDITDNPESADYILFVDAHVVRAVDYDFALRNTTIFREYRYKTFVYNERDDPTLGLPGLYVSMPKPLFAPDYMRAVPYMHYEVDKVDVGVYLNLSRDKFATFMGDVTTSPVRSQLFKLSQSCLSMVNTARLNVHDYTERRRSQEELDFHLHQYCEYVGGSIYSICPRGHGSSSFRLYESLMLGAIPVVLSDDFVSPFLSSDKQIIWHIPEGETRLLCSKLPRDSESISLQQLRCNEIVRRMLSPCVRLDYAVSQIESIAHHQCTFMETHVDEIRRKVYWKIRSIKKKFNAV